MSVDVTTAHVVALSVATDLAHVVALSVAADIAHVVVIAAMAMAAGAPGVGVVGGATTVTMGSKITAENPGKSN